LAATHVLTKKSNSNVESTLRCSIIIWMNGSLFNLMFSSVSSITPSLSVAVNIIIRSFFTVNKIVSSSDNISSSRSPRFLNTTNKPRTHISIIAPIHSFDLDNMLIGRYPIFSINIINVLSSVLRNFLWFSQKSFSAKRLHWSWLGVISHLSNLIVIEFSRKISILPHRSLGTHVFLNLQ